MLIVFLLSPRVPRAVAAQELKEITVWAMGWDGAILREIASAFERAEPGVTVKVQTIPWDIGHEKIITSIMGGVPPDVCQIGTTWMPEFVAMGALEPLDGPAAVSPAGIDFSQFFEGPLASCRYAGIHYGVPWYVDMRLFYYRTDLLASYGFDRFPDTWDEFYLALKKIRDIKAARGEKGYAAFVPAREPFAFLSLLWQNGVDVLDAEGSARPVGSPGAEEAARYWKRIFDEGLSPVNDGTEVLEGFASGYYPVIYSGHWTIAELESKKSELDGKWATAVSPRKKSRHGFIGGSNLAAFRGSRDRETALKFISFAAGPLAQLKTYRVARCLPANRVSWKTGDLASHPPLAAFERQLAETRSPPGVPEWTRIMDIVRDAMEAMTYGRLSPAQAVASLETRIGGVMSVGSVRQSSGFKAAMALLICLAFAASAAAYFRFSGARGGGAGGPVRAPYAYSGLLFIAPAVSVMAVFLFIPIVSSFIISLTNWNIYGFKDWEHTVFVGFDNYRRLLADPVFYRSLQNTVFYACLAVPLNLSIALATAVALNQSFVRFKAIFRLGFFLPVITTFAAVSLTWQWLYNGDIGLVNGLLGVFGIPPANWLASESLALPAIIIMGVWKGFGYNMIVFLAGLQAIPVELYEAAAIDGAGRFQQFVYVTLPMLRRTTFFVAMMTAVGSLHVFAEPFIMTGGGPLDSTMSIVLYMYIQGFKYYNLGYSSAIAYALFAVMAAVTFLQFKVAARLED